MVIAAGIFGLIGGFFLGQMVLYFLLRNVPREKLLNDPTIKWKYGLLNWAIALFGSYSMVVTYQEYFQ
ncbi:MAG: hypothetical protein KA099_00700 [Alphaproteobacteria bacterium]|nr:hypothetical protein [Alphaproteobacteria bacterium]MBP7758121.1 hypothetical protein [Alphaproteobacteria bacterium]MBP7761446.1 hypothetical protein [Alphaproteobacteria bacterium]MBP7903819.1 hypothetical protein [Alphaproteobacteria bacterium]